MTDFRKDLILSCSLCGGIEMKYDEFYLSFKCPKCGIMISAKMRKVIMECFK